MDLVTTDFGQYIDSTGGCDERIQTHLMLAIRIQIGSIEVLNQDLRQLQQGREGFSGQVYGDWPH